MRAYVYVVSVFCLALVACNGGGSPGPVDGNDGGPASAELDPTALKLETPPTDGRLPADLLPPT
jgi:hypothetical protein